MTTTRELLMIKGLGKMGIEPCDIEVQDLIIRPVWNAYRPIDDIVLERANDL